MQIVCALFMVCGLAVVARGLWMIYPPAAWIVIGAVLVAFSVSMYRKTTKTRGNR